MKRIKFIYWLTGFCVLCSCNSKAENDTQQAAAFEVRDSIAETPAEIIVKELAAEDIRIEKELLYDKHTLEDVYPYKDTTRCFQWEKIKERLALLENIRQKPSHT